MDNERLQNAIDIVEITQVINLYGLVVDALAWDLIDQVFTDDVDLDMGPAGTAFPGAAASAAGMDIFEGTMDNNKHAMYTTAVTVHGDTASAITYSDWILVRFKAIEDSSDSYWIGQGWYNDELVRTEKGWRIKKRSTRMMKYFGSAAVCQPVPGQNPTNKTFRLKELSANGEVPVFNDLRSAADYVPFTAWKDAGKKFEQ